MKSLHRQLLLIAVSPQQHDMAIRLARTKNGGKKQSLLQNLEMTAARNARKRAT